MLLFSTEKRIPAASSVILRTCNGSLYNIVSIELSFLQSWIMCGSALWRGGEMWIQLSIMGTVFFLWLFMGVGDKEGRELNWGLQTHSLLMISFWVFPPSLFHSKHIQMQNLILQHGKWCKREICFIFFLNGEKSCYVRERQGCCLSANEPPLYLHFNSQLTLEREVGRQNSGSL